MSKPIRALAVAAATVATAATVSTATAAPAAAVQCGFQASHGEAWFNQCWGERKWVRVEVNENLAPPWIRDHDECIEGFVKLGDYPMIYDAWSSGVAC
ncbi:DUF6355 family natural product biosynthesis protein [Amycolatopsis sp. NPDC059657]|uniref:DUF6355 family natural product biosynthesis protein n=1 Tax=Amycolatopsis sp. NPDC059657 TaxID=3346899 RepID=UPI00366A6BA2